MCRPSRRRREVGEWEQGAGVGVGVAHIERVVD